VERAELIGAAPPADVMNTAARNVLTQLDKVDNGVIDFFVPAATKLLATGQPERVLAAALASMSGFRNPPKPRRYVPGGPINERPKWDLCEEIKGGWRMFFNSLKYYSSISWY
jgi:hypothetical protein